MKLCQIVFSFYVIFLEKMLCNFITHSPDGGSLVLRTIYNIINSYGFRRNSTIPNL